jgi:pyruvate kinase
MTAIVTTIGPVSQDLDTLNFFREHNVEIARLNFSHGTSVWHIETGIKARQAGLKLMLDLAGPKVLIGDLENSVELVSGSVLAIEKQQDGKVYPLSEKVGGEDRLILPSLFDLSKFVAVGHPVLIDDGKVILEVVEVTGNQAICKVSHGGLVKNHKGINLPETQLDIDFLVERDREMLTATINELKPEIVAPSFVKTVKDLHLLKDFLKSIITIEGYFPEICTKVEMGEAVKKDNLEAIVDNSEMIMIARGDLALEAQPLHIMVPFLQEEIIAVCRAKNKPFIVATQILETMSACPVPTRSEVSDLYRAVIINKANYVMLSGESAAGQFPRKCVELMSDMIKMAD